MTPHPGWAAVPGLVLRRTLELSSVLLCWQCHGLCYRSELLAPPSFHGYGCHRSTPVERKITDFTMCSIGWRYIIFIQCTHTMIRMSGLTLGISAAIRCLSSCREKSPVYSSFSVTHRGWICLANLIFYLATRLLRKRNGSNTLDKWKSLPLLQLFQSWTWQLRAHAQRGNTRTWFRPPLWPRGSWWFQSYPCSLPGQSQCTACRLQRCCCSEWKTEWL